MLEIYATSIDYDARAEAGSADVERLLAGLDRRARQRFEQQAVSDGLALMPPVLRA